MNAIREVDPKKLRFRKILLRFLKRAVKLCEIEPEMAGFAVIVWDHRGLCTTTIDTGDGPIGDGMVANYVRDAINRRVASEDALYWAGISRSPDDEPA